MLNLPAIMPRGRLGLDFLHSQPSDVICAIRNTFINAYMVDLEQPKPRQCHARRHSVPANHKHSASCDVSQHIIPMEGSHEDSAKDANPHVRRQCQSVMRASAEAFWPDMGHMQHFGNQWARRAAPPPPPPPPHKSSRVKQHAAQTQTSVVPNGHVRRAPIGREFHAEVFTVAEDVAKEIRELHSVREVRIRSFTTKDGEEDEQYHVEVVAVVGLDAEAMDQSTDMAKQCLFAQTRRGRGVCLLGYKRSMWAFSATKTGFVAQCANTHRKRLACRILYQEGDCKHGDKCYWEHPTSTSSFHFVVEQCP